MSGPGDTTPTPAPAPEPEHVGALADYASDLEVIAESARRVAHDLDVLVASMRRRVAEARSR